MYKALHPKKLGQQVEILGKLADMSETDFIKISWFFGNFIPGIL